MPIDARHGTLVPPADPGVIGWWSRGAVPGGAVGTAILTGHTVSSGGGAFDDLDLMHAGQDIWVDGVRYRVRSVTNYPKQTLADHAARIFSQSAPGRLALVTCEDWTGRVYLSNVVVIAVPE